MESAFLAITLDVSHAYENVRTTALEWGLPYLLENNPRSLSCHPAVHQLGFKCRFLLIHSISALLYWLGCVSQVFPNSYSVVLVYRSHSLGSKIWECVDFGTAYQLRHGDFIFHSQRTSSTVPLLCTGKHSRSSKCMSFRHSPLLAHRKARISVKMKTRCFLASLKETGWPGPRRLLAMLETGSATYHYCKTKDKLVRLTRKTVF